MFVSAGYIVVAVAIGAVLQAVGAPGSTLCWPSLVATALVAVAFQPVRKQVLRLVDRLVYGNRAAPYEALATLGRRLADRSGRPVGRSSYGDIAGHRPVLQAGARRTRPLWILGSTRHTELC